MGTEIKTGSEFWPILPLVEGTKRERKFTLIVIGLISVLCLTMGYIFTLYYKRTNVDVGIVFLSSAISVLGFLAVLIPPILYLRIYNPLWTGLCFFISMALLFLLVSHKFIVTKHSKVMTNDTIARDAFSAYVSAALFEEIIKLVTYLVPIILCKRLRTVYDLAFLAICSGCTFATLENLTSANYGTSTALHRFLWCTATHTSDCLSGALMLAHLKTREIKQKFKWCVYPLVLLVPVILHGTFDFVIFVAEDPALQWLRFLSILIGTASLTVSLLLFWPFRRSVQQPPIAVITSVPCQLSSCPLV